MEAGKAREKRGSADVDIELGGGLWQGDLIHELQSVELGMRSSRGETRTERTG